MVREQEPARNPLQPSMGNAGPPPRSQPGDAKRTTMDESQPLYPMLRQPATEQPEFGKPTLPGASAQSSSWKPAATRPGADMSAPRQASGTQPDKYSSLFVTSKKPAQRPELHKPVVVANPLDAFRKLQNGGTKLDKKPSTRKISYDDLLLEIAKPANFGPNPRPPPTFSSKTYTNPHVAPRHVVDLTSDQPFLSSKTYTNPYVTPRHVVDLTIDQPSFPSANQLWREDKYAFADPGTYMDAAKANETIKALLEGAFEDDDDESQKQEVEQPPATDQLDDLAEGMKALQVVKAETTDKNTDGPPRAKKNASATVAGLKVALLPHQEEGLRWMKEKEAGTKKTKGLVPKGGILADDMGLGKTIQSIALILSHRRPGEKDAAHQKTKVSDDVGKATLVVAPLALIKQWEGELNDRVEKSHALQVCVHHGPQRAKSYKELQKYDVVITTYHTLSSEHAASTDTLRVGCFGVYWFRVILDEAHSIKNRNAKATEAACALNAEYRWCLTGTPMQNNLDELQSLIHFLRIRPFDDLKQWRAQITQPMASGRGGVALKRLQVYLKAIMKRRTKDILKQQTSTGLSGAASNPAGSQNFKIVERTIEDVQAEFTQQEREFYSRLESRTDRSLELMMAGNKMSYASALVLLMRLRQACNHPKLMGSDLSNELDAMGGAQTPGRRHGPVEPDMDSIADIFGGLSVETRRCDVCQMELDAVETSGGGFRCTECRADLAEQATLDRSRRKALQTKKVRQERKTLAAQRKKARNVVLDSDDEASEDDETDTGASTEDDGNYDDEDEAYSSDEAGLSEATPFQSTKIRQLLRILQADAHQHKYIVFSIFTSMLDLVEPFLHTHRIRFVRYDGKMRNDARESSLHALRTDPAARVLLCSLRAGSLGLNLTAASRVVILEPFWNPFVEEQAIDRVHRLNQTQDVKVYKLTVKDTVEERIVQLQEKKRELANAAIEGKAGALKLTLQDMLRLFGRDADMGHAAEPTRADSGRRAGLLDARPAVAPPATAGNMGSGRERDRARCHGGGRPVREEHPIYGRRW